MSISKLNLKCLASPIPKIWLGVKFENKKLNYCRGTTGRAVSWNFINCCTTVRKKITLDKAFSRSISLKVTQGHRNCLYSMGNIYHFLLAVCSNNDIVLHRFREIATFTVYVTGCDLKKSFIFEKTVEITSHVRFPIIHVWTYHRQYTLYFHRYSNSCHC